MEFPLPDELTELIFNYLDVPSLLRCMQVCRLFRSIISENTHLTYEIELFESCMEDNQHSPMDIVSRLKLLREYNRVWNNMEWTPSGSIPMSDGCWEFLGGVLAQVTDGDALSLVQLPCKLKGIPERSWTASFDFTIRDFTVDNSQDLIILLELVGTFPAMSCNVHLRTLTGEPHPRSAVTHITYPSATLRASFSFPMQICGDHIAVLFYDRFSSSHNNAFLVWNWRTGEQEVVSSVAMFSRLSVDSFRDQCIRVAEFNSFAFMTEDLILAAIFSPESEEPEPTLQVLRIVPNDPIDSLEGIPHICELQLPKIQGTVERLLIRSLPTPTWKPPAGSAVPFYTSPKDSIFSIAIRIVGGLTEENIVIFVPLSNLLLEMERSHDVPRRSIPWDAWGPGGTRILPMRPSRTWICYTHGMKHIQAVSWRDGHNVMQVYDFNPYAVKKHVQTSADASTPWKYLEQESTFSQIFHASERVVTRLPGRVATLAIEDVDHRWHAAMIGEDQIVMVQVRRASLSRLVTDVVR